MQQLTSPRTTGESEPPQEIKDNDASHYTPSKHFSPQKEGEMLHPVTERQKQSRYRKFRKMRDALSYSNRPDFVLDCVCPNQSSLPHYNSYLDKNLETFFSKPTVRKHILQVEKMKLEHYLNPTPLKPTSKISKNSSVPCLGYRLPPVITSSLGSSIKVRGFELKMTEFKPRKIYGSHTMKRKVSSMAKLKPMSKEELLRVFEKYKSSALESNQEEDKL